MLWLMYAILSAFSDSCSRLCDKVAIKEIDPTVTATLYFTIEAISLITFSLVCRKISLATIRSFNPSNLFFITLAGIIGSFSWIFYLTALKHGPLTKVAITDHMGLLFTTFLSTLLLGEILPARQLIGTILITIGSFLVALT